MAAATPTRLLDHLPAIYRSGDGGDDDLARLLGVFEEFFFVGGGQAPQQVDGIARRLEAIPALFAPLGLGSDDHGDDHDSDRTPAPFVPWLATWLSFTPHHLFEPERLRHIVAGIVPLYGKRGTRAYLEALLTLCFADEIAGVSIDEQALGGLCIGSSKLGVDSRLSEERPFWFSVDIEVRRDDASPAGASRLEQRVRTIIDFARPAHTAYSLTLRPGHAAFESPSR